MFEKRTPVIIFNGWTRGSVVCDYEIKIVQPIRELSAQAAGPSPADLFLNNLGSAFKLGSIGSLKITWKKTTVGVLPSDILVVKS